MDSKTNSAAYIQYFYKKFLDFKARASWLYWIVIVSLVAMHTPLAFLCLRMLFYVQVLLAPAFKVLKSILEATAPSDGDSNSNSATNSSPKHSSNHNKGRACSNCSGADGCPCKRCEDARSASLLQQSQATATQPSSCWVGEAGLVAMMITVGIASLGILVAMAMSSDCGCTSCSQ